MVAQMPAGDPDVATVVIERNGRASAIDTRQSPVVEAS